MKDIERKEKSGLNPLLSNDLLVSIAYIIPGLSPNAMTFVDHSLKNG